MSWFDDDNPRTHASEPEGGTISSGDSEEKSETPDEGSTIGGDLSEQTVETGAESTDWWNEDPASDCSKSGKKKKTKKNCNWWDEEEQQQQQEQQQDQNEQYRDNSPQFLHDLHPPYVTRFFLHVIIILFQARIYKTHVFKGGNPP